MSINKSSKLTVREQVLIIVIFVLCLIIAMLSFAAIKFYNQLYFRPRPKGYSYYADAMKEARCAVFEKNGADKSILLKYDLQYLPTAIAVLPLVPAEGSLDKRNPDSWIYRLVFNDEEVFLGGTEVEIIVYDDLLFVNGQAFGEAEGTPFHYYIAAFETQFDKYYQLSYGANP